MYDINIKLQQNKSKTPFFKIAWIHRANGMYDINIKLLQNKSKTPFFT